MEIDAECICVDNGCRPSVIMENNNNYATEPKNNFNNLDRVTGYGDEKRHLCGPSSSQDSNGCGAFITSSELSPDCVLSSSSSSPSSGHPSPIVSHSTNEMESDDHSENGASGGYPGGENISPVRETRIDVTRRISEESSASASASLSPNGSKESNGSASGSSKNSKNQKVCDVCSDVAKSLHFGGLTCDSCKAFFRRSVHKDAYLQFSCGYDNSCHIDKQTRKSCQKCRFEKCIQIGMEMKWVMSEDERKNLNSMRMKKKRENSSGSKSPIDPPSEYGSSSFPQPPLQNQSSSSSCSIQPQYIPNVDEMLNYMSESEQQKIRRVCEYYRVSYAKIPYDVPKTSEGIRNTLQTIGMFTTILRRFAYFSKLVPEFCELNKNDQGNLLKASVLEMVMLRGALSFDIENHRWPNSNFEFLKNCPQLRIDDMKHLASPELFEMHMSFITKIQKHQVDEPTTMLLLLIVMFYPERSDIEEVDKVSAAQEKYSELLQKYVNWRYGPDGAKLYPKLLTQLSDLRQLNDLHTEYHLNLAETEVNVIRQDLSHLKLEPYTQWKIVNPNPDKSAASPKFPAEQDSFSPPGPVIPQLSPPNQSLPLSPSSSGNSNNLNPPTGPIRTSHSHLRAHTKMRQAFLRRIPNLIEDPFGPLMSQEEMIMMGQHYGGLFTQPPQPPTVGAVNSPLDHQTHHRSHHQQQHHHSSSSDSSTTSQNSQFQPHHINNQMFDMNNAKSILESLDEETRARLQTMFSSGISTQNGEIPSSFLGGAITPGFFANLFSTTTTSGEHQNSTNNLDSTAQFPN